MVAREMICSKVSIIGSVLLDWVVGDKQVMIPLSRVVWLCF